MEPMSSGFLGLGHNSNPLQHNQQQQQNPHHMHGNYPPFSTKNKKHQQASLSDEDEGIGDPNNKRKNSSSPWQRMKWTDTMVRLLIMAVYYIGDEGGGSEGSDPNGKKAKSTGLLQKKGKWKSVSRAMMEKGFYVSPQQCEDKFNDLNKRYKRVNDILGKGTACRVVEDQRLLDTMDRLSPKAKEEARKLLNSKHLFFREMCAYHNSCGHGAANNSGGSSVVPPQVEVGVEASHQAQQQQEHEEQRCFHFSDDNGVANLANSKVGCGEEVRDHNHDDNDDDDEDDEEDASEDSSDEDDDKSGEECGASRGEGGNGHDEDHEGNENRDHHGIRPTSSSSSRKRSRKTSSPPPSSSSMLVQQLMNEVSVVFQDMGRSIWEKKEWVRSRIVQLEEEQVRYKGQGFEIEKQKLKWERFSRKKEREMERSKIENERKRIENERMVLLIKQKELEFMNQQHQQQHSST